jgi:hypothetical protein
MTSFRLDEVVQPITWRAPLLRSISAQSAP